MSKIDNNNLNFHIIGKFDDIKELPYLANRGDTAIVKDESYTYYPEVGWIKSDSSKFGLNFSNYELNKMAVSSFPRLSTKQLNKGKKLIDDFIHSSNKHYFMLLNYDLKYFTLLKYEIGHNELASDIIEECISNFGLIKSIDFNEDKTSIECWVTDKNKESYMFLLFSYDEGVEICG